MNIYQIDPTPVDPQADDTVRAFMQYFAQIYGKRILSGQFTAGDAARSPEMKALYEVTGKYPAIAGFDFIEYTPSRVARGSHSTAVEDAISWWKRGGIVTFCWHWGAPSPYLLDTKEHPWQSGFYTASTNFDLAKAMNGEDPEGYHLLISDMDAIAEQLRRLQDAGVPVLWRPLHEASGGWFWWGAAGAQACLALWKLMYHRLTEVHGLHNLIWVWNGQAEDWYPGNKYVDLIGEDIYPSEGDHSAQKERFSNAVRWCGGKKAVALTENSSIPSLEAMEEGDCHWLMFTTWCGSFAYNEDGSYQEKYNDAAFIRGLMNDERVITLDRLPDFSSGRLS